MQEEPIKTEHLDPAWVMGVDIGTGSCKTIIIDARGRVLGFGDSVYEIQGGARKWKEQDPESLVVAMVRSVRAAIAGAGVEPSTCRGMSIGGAFHSLIAVDRAGDPLTGVSTWVDDRATGQAGAIREEHDPIELYQQTGCPVHSMYPLYKLIWLRQEHPEIFDQAARFISAKEYVLARLTGEYLVDYGIAGGTALLNTRTLEWDPLSLDLAGVTPDRLSPLCPPDYVIQGLDPELALQMGLPPGTPLVLGSADAVNSSLGAGAVTPGRATCMIGTSGAFRIIAPRPMLDKEARSWCYAIDRSHWLVGGAINNGGLALSWLREALNGTLVALAEGGQFSFDDLVALADQAPPGAEGLVCLPFFAGERSPYWNMDARGVFFGLSLGHDMRHIARALLEGVAFRLRSVRDVLAELGAEVQQVLASGGFTRSDLWPQIVADVLNHELLVPASGETSSLGAAFWALLGTGAVERLEDLDALVPIDRRYGADQEVALHYEKLFRLYVDLYALMGDSFERVAGLVSGAPGVKG